MLTIYRLFQIIMGIILSGFIFYLLVSYAGNYAQLGDKAARLKTLDVFIQDADNAYVTGIPLNFTGFSRDDFSSCYSRPGSPPRIFCLFDGETQESEPLRIPILLKPGPDVLVSLGTIDYGWTRLGYVMATPPMTIVFNPLSADDEAWELMASIAGAFPDTTGVSPKIRFDICDGDRLMIKEVSDPPYERDEFIGIIQHVREAYSPCTASLSPAQFLVTVSGSCSGHLDSGLCAVPSGGPGYAFLGASGFIYKDPADIAALMIGGRGMGHFGKTVGEETYGSKNDVMSVHLSNAAAVMSRRSFDLKGSSQLVDECRTLYLALYQALESVRTLARGDYTDMDEMTDLSEALAQASLKWDQLIEKGCEPRGTG